MFGLDVDTLRGIQGAIAAVEPIEKVLIYGSRAKGNYRIGSDIDITLMGRNLTLYNSIHPLYQQLDELLLPYMFDISILKQIDDLNVVEHILRVGKVFYERPPTTTEAAASGQPQNNAPTDASTTKATTSHPTPHPSSSGTTPSTTSATASNSSPDSAPHASAAAGKAGTSCASATNTIASRQQKLQGTNNTAHQNTSPTSTTTATASNSNSKPDKKHTTSTSSGNLTLGLPLKQGAAYRRPRGYPAAPERSGRAHLSRPPTGGLLFQDQPDKQATPAPNAATNTTPNTAATPSLPSNWRMVKLGDVCEVLAGQSPKGEFYNTSGSGTPFFQGKKDFGAMYLQEPTKWTTSVTRLAYKGDILMSVRAPVGPVNFTTTQICIGRGLAAIRPSKKMDRMFLFHKLFSMQDKIEGSGGAVFASISKEQIKQIPIPLPPLKVQNKIVEDVEHMQKNVIELKQMYTQKLADLNELKKITLKRAFDGKTIT